MDRILSYNTKFILSSGRKIKAIHEKYFKLVDEISFKNVIFEYNNENLSYNPVSGDYNVLGVIIPLKEYSWNELKEIIGDDRVVLNVNKRIDGDDFFDIEEIESFVDYSKLVTELESLNLIKTKPSKSWIANDTRIFSFGDLDDNGDEIWFEVDILGTFFGKDYFSRLKNMFDETLPKCS